MLKQISFIISTIRPNFPFPVSFFYLLSYPLHIAQQPPIWVLSPSNASSKLSLPWLLPPWPSSLATPIFSAQQPLPFLSSLPPPPHSLPRSTGKSQAEAAWTAVSFSRKEGRLWTGECFSSHKTDTHLLIELNAEYIKKLAVVNIRGVDYGDFFLLYSFLYCLV